MHLRPLSSFWGLVFRCKWILHQHAGNELAMVEVFAEQNLAARRFGANGDKRIPKGDLVEDATVDGLFYKRRRDADDFHIVQGVYNALGQQGIYAELLRGGDVEFLQHLR